MTRSKRLLIFNVVVLVPLAVILTLTVGDWLRSAILNPVVYFILILKEFVTALPDLPIWLVFVFIAALVVSVMMIGLFPGAPKPSKEQRLVSRGPVSELAERVKLAPQGEFFKWRLTRQLSDLTIDLIAMRRRLDQKNARQLFEAGAWTGEPRVKAFLRTEPQSASKRISILERFLRHFKLRHTNDKRYRAELEKVVGFLEAYARERL